MWPQFLSSRMERTGIERSLIVFPEYIEYGGFAAINWMQLRKHSRGGRHVAARNDKMLSGIRKPEPNASALPAILQQQR
jgi:hypothetical protein